MQLLGVQSIARRGRQLQWGLYRASTVLRTARLCRQRQRRYAVCVRRAARLAGVHACRLSIFGAIVAPRAQIAISVVRCHVTSQTPVSTLPREPATPRSPGSSFDKKEMWALDLWRFELQSARASFCSHQYRVWQARIEQH